MKRWITIVAMILAVLWLCTLEVRLREEHDLSAFNTWVSNLHIACQDGATESGLKKALIQPLRVERFAEMENASRLAQRMPSVTKARSVYVYSHFSQQNQGVWYAYVFVGESGQVLGCYIFNWSDSP